MLEAIAYMNENGAFFKVPEPKGVSAPIRRPPTDFGDTSFDALPPVPSSADGPPSAVDSVNPSILDLDSIDNAPNTHQNWVEPVQLSPEPGEVTPLSGQAEFEGTNAALANLASGEGNASNASLLAGKDSDRSSDDGPPLPVKEAASHGNDGPPLPAKEGDSSGDDGPQLPVKEADSHDNDGPPLPAKEADSSGDDGPPLAAKEVTARNTDTNVAQES